MSEIEKMYENAGIKPTHYDACTLEDKYWEDGVKQNLYGTFDSYLSFECPHYGEGCYSTCEYAYDKDEYPPFTAEKQLELIKFLLNQGVYYSTFPNDTYQFHISDDIENPQPRKFDIAIAEIINDLWQDLTEEEKQQVKGILE